MVFRAMRVVLFLFLIGCLAGALPAWAQSTSTGTVAGTVTDSSGAVVASATVTLTDTATNTPRTATTNDAGRYIFVDVNPGTYNVEVNKHGFATTKIDNQEVKVGAALTLNASLQVGGTNTVVEVEATGTELQTMNATVGNTVTSIAIDNLPSIGRDVNTFIELQPGVGTDGSVGGAVNDQSFFSLDGGNNSNDMDGNGTVYTGNQIHQSVGDPTGGVAAQYVGGAGVSGVMPTPADSVEEFKVNTAGQTADFNSSAGAEVKVVTKRGSNTFHGTAYEYYRDNNWSGNSWQNSFSGVPLPSFHYSRFGAAVGGPLIPKEVLGGKTYFFGNFEGFRYPNAETITRNVASPALRLGLLTDSTTGAIDYNLNNYPVTYNNIPYPANYGCSAAPGGLCDPLGLGITPVLTNTNHTGIWDKYEPASNISTCSGQSLCDGANIQAFSANLNIPISSNFAVFRMDHDFSSKQHFMASYRYYNMKYAGDDQVDIGGAIGTDKLGVPASLSSDPVQDWYLVLGLTSNITSNTTNDFHYSFLRNWWQWGRAGAPPQLAGLGAAVEIMSGQSQTQDLGPYNVNNQNIRQRFWDGHDQMFRDDLSLLKGNHLFQFGGYFQHNFDYHQRNDSGGTINAYPVYSIGDGSSGSLLGSDVYPCSVATTTINNCGAVTAAVLGMVSVANQLFTRSGNDLALNPPLSNAYDKSTIPFYNIYFSDTWHVKPSFTFTYGLGWALEMPPTEATGKQTILVDQSNEPVSVEDYLQTRERLALQGQVYNPELGFSLVGNTGNGRKYPYNPFYGEFSPRVAVAWNPKFDSDSLGGKIFGHDSTVVRGGYARIFGRLNGVDLVLVPLLGLGLEQAVSCQQNIVVGGAWQCGASGIGNPSNAFRVGLTPSATGGPVIPLTSLATPTLPQPVFPGYNNTFTSAAEGLDPNWRPNVTDSFDLTIQRQVSRRVTLEFGYIGRRIRDEFQPIDLNTVPYMMTVGGQNFKNAYMNMVLQYCGGVAGMAGGGCAANLGAVTPQPFFENSLNPSYCAGFSSCTAAVASNETFNITNAQVWSLWSDLDNGNFNFPRTMENTPIASLCNTTTTVGCSGQASFGMALNASVGYGNYNAGFASVKIAEWKGLTAQSNFTYSKALGTGAFVQASSEYTPLDAFDLSSTYGRQGFDRKFTYNAFLVYQPPFFKGQNGLMGRVLGGWTFSSIFTAGSGTPNEIYTDFGNGQSFGGDDGVYYFNNENAVPIGPVGKHSHAYYNSPSNGLPVNEFKDGINEANNWRNPVLGLDTKDGGVGILNGLPYWNMDFSIKKNIRVAERVGLELQGVFENVLNHNQWLDPTFDIGLFNPGGWGALPGEAQPRNVEVGARVRF